MGEVSEKIDVVEASVAKLAAVKREALVVADPFSFRDVAELLVLSLSPFLDVQLALLRALSLFWLPSTIPLRPHLSLFKVGSAVSCSAMVTGKVTVVFVGDDEVVVPEPRVVSLCGIALIIVVVVVWRNEKQEGEDALTYFRDRSW